MSEREPERLPPEGVPPAALGWYARMERQSAPRAQAGAPPAGPSPAGPSPAGPSPAGPSPTGTARSGPATAALPAVSPATRSGRRDRRRARAPRGPTGRPPGRRVDRDLVLWAIGALVLAAAAVVAIFFGDDLRRTSADGSERPTATDQPEAPESTLPSATGSAETPTDPGGVPTGTAAPPTGTPTVSGAGDDPLGLGVPMTPPACDGTWIVVVGSATQPSTYRDDVSALLSADPAARYVLTAGQCPSLRQQTAEGNQIYAVYLGPFPDQASACSTSTGLGNGAYVKRMDGTTPPEQIWEC